MKVDPSDPAKIAEAVLGYQPEEAGDGRDRGKKSRYLSYRLTGFTEMESIELAKVHHRSVLNWREADAMFRAIDLNENKLLVKLRGELSSKFLDIEFTRNFRLVLEKDFNVLYKSVTEPDSLTDREHEYLLKLRSHYGAQQLGMMKQLLSGGTVEQPFDFTKMVISIKRERESVEIKNG